MVSSLFLGSAVLSVAGLLASPAAAQSGSTYILDTEYSGASFFNGFDFFTAADPTNGFVTYVDEADAESASLISSGVGQPATFGVDHTTTLASDGSQGGRKSVRITSQKSWTHGLFIGDIAHMPGGICGTWPAFWTLGPNWPSNGEIDIIEGVNDATNNLMSLHTSPGCTIAGANETGTLQSSDCDTSVNYNSGCGVTSNTAQSYGAGFNGVGGGVYAMQWTSDYIRIWFFPAGSVPVDITAGTPDPSTWGEPAANMEGSCNIDSHFASHQIIFDTTFCGDYGNAVWSSDATCSAKASTCNAYVAGNPSDFADAYWSVNSVKVYQLPASSTSSSSSSSSTSLSSVAPASSVLDPGMGNTTTASTSSAAISVPSSTTAPYAVASTTSAAAGSSPNSSGTSSNNPSVIGTYEYYGCYGSQGNFSSFNLVANSSSMSNDQCVALCAGSTYAGTFSTQCYCGSSIDTSTTPASGVCNIPCPGNSAESCGGSVITSAKVRRAAPNNILLSLYTVAVNGGSSSGAVSSSGGSTTGVAFVAGAGSGSESGISSTTAAVVGGVSPVHYNPSGLPTGSVALVSVAPASATLGYGMGGSFATTTVVTTTYVDVCPTGLVTSTAVVTITQCGCTNTANVLGQATTVNAGPAIPVTTTAKECTACAATGGPATVTVTIPIASTGPVASSAAAGTTPVSTVVITTIAGQATTTTLSAANFAAVSTAGVPAGATIPSFYNSSSNASLAGAAIPSMQAYPGEGETLRVASGLFCVVLLVIALIL